MSEVPDSQTPTPSAPAQSNAAAAFIEPHAIREMLAIAGPTVAAMTSYTLMTFVDKWLVSHIGPDPIYVGAQGNGGLAAWIPISVAHGLLTMVNTFVAQNMGAGKPERGPAYAWNGFWLAMIYWLAILIPLAIAIPFLFDYLAQPSAGQPGMDPRQATLSAQYGSILLYGAGITLATRAVGQFFYGMHRPGVVMTAGILANIVNLFISCILVYGNGPMPEALGLFGRVCSSVGVALNIPAMGIAGSAIGTVIATAVELALPLALFLGPKLNRLYATRAAWRPNLTHLKDLSRLGWPGGIMFGNEMICWGFFMVYLVSRFGPEHTTAGWIAHQYMSLSFMPAVGISVAVTALVGKYQGMGRSDIAAARAWLGVKIAMVYMGICAAIFILFPHTLINLFVDDATDAAQRERLLWLGQKFLIATAAFQLFDAVAMVISGALRGAGDTIVPGIATVVSAWLIIVGGGLAMVFFFPGLESLGPWIAAAAYIATLCMILLVRFMSGRWKSIKLVHGDASLAAG